MILLYHTIVPDDCPPGKYMSGGALPQAAFRRHLRWLAGRYEVVSLTNYLDSIHREKSPKRKQIAVTLDDGFDITFQCAVPVLAELGIPATIFISTGHVEKGDLLWFSYLKALCFERRYPEVQVGQQVLSMKTKAQRDQGWDLLSRMAKASGDPSGFCRTIAQHYPLNGEVQAFYAGMTYKQIRMAAENDQLELGAHTVTHPFLSQLSKEAQEKEILGSKTMLSRLSGREIRYFAYPGGDYNADTLEVMQTSDFRAAFAVIPRGIGRIAMLEVSRIGIYSQSLLKLQMKAAGLANLGRSFGLRVG